MRLPHLALLLAVMPALAASPADLQAGYAAQARSANPAFAGFSAERGRAFFTEAHGREWSCATCHGAAPTVPGKHATTGKTIAPLAPASNPDRLASPDKVEKWFRRNCMDVAGRECTAAEKGDVIAFLRTLK